MLQILICRRGCPVGSAGKAVTGLTPGETRTVNFGFDDSGRLVGHVWHDKQRQRGHARRRRSPAMGIEVCAYLDTNINGLLDGMDSLVACRDTNGSGDAAFTGLPAGAYL